MAGFRVNIKTIDTIDLQRQPNSRVFVLAIKKFGDVGDMSGLIQNFTHTN